MTSASSRAAFLSVVHRGDVFLRRLVRVVGRFLSQLFLAVLRVVITGVVFSAGVMVMLYYLGVPVPGPAELLDKFGALGRLVDILS